MFTPREIAAASCSLLLLSGCSVVPSTYTSETNPVPGAALHGNVHGGQQPIAGASVYLYVAAATGYGNASIPLLTNPVTTDANGNFTITADYTCPATASQAYLYAVGGNPGSGTNSAAGLLAALGTCPAGSTFPSGAFVFMNEVSTVATAYSIAGYATDATHVSSSGSTLAKAGITNAFATVENLETLNTGAALATTPGLNGTVPQSEINTLANILAACINSTGPTSSNCATLFGNAKNGAITPTDTATAAINIAHNPAANIAALYGLQAAGGVQFQPNLTAAPNDFTIAITYTGGGLNISNALAIDASNNIWVTNGNGSSISKFSPLGVPNANSPFTGGGLANPGAIAIDIPGNIWAANENSNTISGLSPSGAVLPISPISNGGLASPTSLAIDSSGYIWASNYGASSISKFSVLGIAIPGSPYTGGGLSHPYSIAIDTSGNVWATNPNANVVSELSSSGSPVSASGYTTGGLNAPLIVAIDASGNAWVDNDGGGSAGFYTVYNSSGTAISGTSGYSGGGLDEPGAVAIDGSGNAWAVNSFVPGSISVLTSSGTPISGQEGYEAGLQRPSSIAIDGSGNAWVTNVYFGANSITEFVGAATPVVTPIVANLVTPYASHAVNKP